MSPDLDFGNGATQGAMEIALFPAFLYGTSVLFYHFRFSGCQNQIFGRILVY
jgi:hypothetical protein